MNAVEEQPARRAPAPRQAPVRLLTLTTLFPNSVQSRHGIFVAARLRRMCDTGEVSCTVIAAVPRFPGAYRAQSRVPASEEVDGLRVFHPRYFHVPGLGMRLQPKMLAASLLAELGRRGLNGDAFDVVDAHYFYPDGVAAARVARELRLPLVISARGSDINVIGKIGFARRAMVAAARSSQATIAVSRALAERMAELGMARDRMHVLRNGVDAKVFTPMPRDAARRRIGAAPDVPLVLGVGNLVQEKAWDLLIRAVARMPTAHLLLVGDGPLRGALESLARNAAPERVRFLSNMPQTELRVAYAAADVMGLPSLREGWPNVVLEAMSCGTPVVASHVGGIPEILQPGSPAVLLDERTAEAWAAGLATLIAAAHAPSAVHAYAAAFGWEQVVAEQVALYRDVAAVRQRRECSDRSGRMGEP